jgi:hypothetical protein
MDALNRLRFAWRCLAIGGDWPDLVRLFEIFEK